MRLKPFRLRPGGSGKIRITGEYPGTGTVAFGTKMVEGWGLKVEIGTHALTTKGTFWPAKTNIDFRI
jgi:hypothetical protein